MIHSIFNNYKNGLKVFSIALVLLISTNIFALPITITKIADGNDSISNTYPLAPGFENHVPVRAEIFDALTSIGIPVQGQFDQFVRPVIDGNNMAFFASGFSVSDASITPNDPSATLPIFTINVNGLYMNSGSTTSVFPFHAIANTSIIENNFDLAGNFINIPKPFNQIRTRYSISSGEVAFSATRLDFSTLLSHPAVYVGSEPLSFDIDSEPMDLRILADDTTTPPGSSNTFTTLGTPSIDNNGDTVFQGFAGSAEFGIYGDLGVVVDNNTQIPGIPSLTPFVPGFFSSAPFFVPSIDNGAVAFNAHPLSVANGVYVREANGTLRTIATGATPIPNGSGVFRVFDSIRISAGNVRDPDSGETKPTPFPNFLRMKSAHKSTADRFLGN